MNNNYYRKYIKYKTKYINLQSGGAGTSAEVAGTSAEVAGTSAEVAEIEHKPEYIKIINEVSDLIFNMVPFESTINPSRGPQITPAWSPYIDITRSGHTPKTGIITDLFKNKINEKIIYNSRGQTLLYIALSQRNMPVVRFLIRHCEVDITLLNNNNNSILHAIAWSDKYSYDEKINLIINMRTLTVDCHRLRDCLNEFNRDHLNGFNTSLAMFMDYNKDFTLTKNSKDETWLDNLLFKHPKELNPATIQEIIYAATT
jgi:hypothetical protein